MKKDVIVIGGNAGAFEPLQRIITALPKDFPAAILAVIHLAPEDQLQLVNIFKGPDVILTVLAKDGQPIRPGILYLARPGAHLKVRVPGDIEISRGPPENGFRPSMNVLFRSAAEVFGPCVIGILLSGLVIDGIEGLREIKRRGGITIVQKPEETLYPEMPSTALHYDIQIDYVLNSGKIAAVLRRLAGT